MSIYMSIYVCIWVDLLKIYWIVAGTSICISLSWCSCCLKCVPVRGGNTAGLKVVCWWYRVSQTAEVMSYIWMWCLQSSWSLTQTVCLSPDWILPCMVISLHLICSVSLLSSLPSSLPSFLPYTLSFLQLHKTQLGPSSSLPNYYFLPPFARMESLDDHWLKKIYIWSIPLPNPPSLFLLSSLILLLFFCTILP